MAKIKGNALNRYKQYLQEKFGEDCIEKIMQTLDPSDQETLAKTITAISWVDYGAVFRFLVAADKVCGQGNKQIIRDIEIYTAQNDLRGVYQMLLSMVSIDFLVKNVPRAWGLLFRDAGQVTVESYSRGRGVLKITGAQDMPLGHEWDFIPYMEEVLRLNKAKNIRILHPKCIARGDLHCIFDFSWEEN